mmetsp:Transcript_23468/g.65509  ORF Transcript_23468/g.65509 Transcript_23468/m.65509 type:complete len:223 (+) Transcript_23468:3528-4196(+)
MTGFLSIETRSHSTSQIRHTSARTPAALIRSPSWNSTRPASLTHSAASQQPCPICRSAPSPSLRRSRMAYKSSAPSACQRTNPMSSMPPNFFSTLLPASLPAPTVLSSSLTSQTVSWTRTGLALPTPMPPSRGAKSKSLVRTTSTPTNVKTTEESVIPSDTTTPHFTSRHCTKPSLMKPSCARPRETTTSGSAPQFTRCPRHRWRKPLTKEITLSSPGSLSL